jgi:hypothetical protein
MASHIIRTTTGVEMVTRLLPLAPQTNKTSNILSRRSHAGFIGLAHALDAPTTGAIPFTRLDPIRSMKVLQALLIPTFALAFIVRKETFILYLRVLQSSFGLMSC